MAGIFRSSAARSLALRVRGATPAPPRRGFAAAAVEEESGYWTEWEEEEEVAERDRRSPPTPRLRGFKKIMKRTSS